MDAVIRCQTPAPALTESRWLPLGVLVTLHLLPTSHRAAVLLKGGWSGGSSELNST